MINSLGSFVSIRFVMLSLMLLLLLISNLESNVSGFESKSLNLNSLVSSFSVLDDASTAVTSFAAAAAVVVISAFELRLLLFDWEFVSLVFDDDVDGKIILFEDVEVVVCLCFCFDRNDFIFLFSFFYNKIMIVIQLNQHFECYIYIDLILQFFLSS